MAALAEAQPRGSAEFVESSILEAVVPSDSEFDAEEELTSWDGTNDEEKGSVLPFLSQRQVLLFDELVPVYIVFRTPLMEDATLKSYLSRLAINVEALAFSTAPPPDSDSKGPPSKELLASETITSAVEPVIVRHDEASSPHIYVVWKLEIFMSRPRGRFQKPAIYFMPTASLKPAEKKSVLEDEYLPSRTPTALNLLQSFESDPALAGIHPRLSALRINKIAPTAPVAKELTRPIRTGQRRLFRALPALIWRVRYSKVQTAISDMSLMASLDLEVAYITGCRLAINDVKLSLRGGDVKPISDQSIIKHIHKPGDQLTSLYKITPDLAVDGTPLFGNEGHLLTLEIKAKVLVSEDCQPNVSIGWQTAVDFSAEQNSALVKAAHRLSNPLTHAPKIPETGSTTSHDKVGQTAEIPKDTSIHVTLTISGPPQVTVGEMFNWSVFIVNRSDKTRKLAVLVVPRRRRDYDKQRPLSSASSVAGYRSDKKDLLANAVVDENIVYAKQKNARTETAELICLTTDIRIGHLAPGACYTADLKFLALSAGVLSVDAVRLVDLATNETSDIRDVPAIVAVEHKG
ncbi:hypothetical protein DPSP01_002035 [Paraphaeosphaeria sporulosa]|uniref:Trafficking protein particle complex II-specific subunit 65 IgD3 domain-containing protein n=1 Tax=Paraphaeosphaeria sporulosa TaxID=1460663 RepID=A0A177D0L4_9PLEO|nr:uncharacterized protein CC84DRAFT_124406 [Paraphaeosphaeria sporulosa]OAG12509.1 hypothetical protein CC84DRAFT_124406 [Paraphaeosphaeria sporulosa]